MLGKACEHLDLMRDALLSVMALSMKLEKQLHSTLSEACHRKTRFQGFAELEDVYQMIDVDALRKQVVSAVTRCDHTWPMMSLDDGQYLLPHHRQYRHRRVAAGCHDPVDRQQTVASYKSMRRFSDVVLPGRKRSKVTIDAS